MVQSAFEPLRDGDFHQHLADARGRALVLFSGPACGACRSVAARLPEAAAGAGIDHLFFVDVETSTGVAREFEVFHLPTLLLFNNGEFHAEINCEISAKALRTAIDTALAQPACDAP